MFTATSVPYRPKRFYRRSTVRSIKLTPDLTRELRSDSVYKLAIKEVTFVNPSPYVARFGPDKVRTGP